MKYGILLAITVMAFFASSLVRAEDKILIAGDSWAFFLCANKSLSQVLDAHPETKLKVYPTCLVTSRVGMRAENWKGTGYDKLTRSLVKYDKSIKIVLLSLGGNDIMNHWNKDMTPDQEQTMFRKVNDDIQAIVGQLRSTRPDLKVIISGYDYPRFIENHPIKEYAEGYNDMGKPSFAQVNAGLMRFGISINRLADQKNVFFIHHLGLMQYYYGNVADKVPAYRTLNPDGISPASNPVVAGGTMASSSDPQAMLKVGGIVDAFHLSSAGFDRVAEHVYRNYLRNW